MPKQPPDRPLLGPAEVGVAGQRLIAGAVGAADADIAVVSHNPMRQLLHFLRVPDPARWELLALSWVAGAASAERQDSVEVSSAAAAVESVLSGGPVVGGAASGPVEILHWRAVTAQGLGLDLLLDARAVVGGPNAERWTVVARLADGAGAEPGVWRDWLGAANLLQFFQGDGRHALITTAADAPLLDAGDVVPRELEIARESADQERVTDLSPDATEELELVFDGEVRTLAEAVLRRGVPVPVAGFEPDAEAGVGWVVEVAWPDVRVAVLSDADEARDIWLAAHGWDARPTADWTVEGLVVAVMGRR